MGPADSLKQQIEKTEIILAESIEYFQKNPDSYSAKLLLMSTENHLADLLRQLQSEKAQQKDQED